MFLEVDFVMIINQMKDFQKIVISPNTDNSNHIVQQNLKQLEKVESYREIKNLQNYIVIRLEKSQWCRNIWKTVVASQILSC